MGIVKDILYKISSSQHLEKVKNQSVFPYYHIVANDKKWHIKYLYLYKGTECFYSDIELLSKHYIPLPVEKIIEAKEKRNTFLLTFDDGLREVYTTIYPILKEKGLSAVFFINPDYVDNKKMMYKHRLSVLLSFIEKSNFDKNILNQVARICSFTYRDEKSFKQIFLKLKSVKEKEIDQVFELLNINEKEYLEEKKLYLSRDEIQEMMDNGFYFGGHSMSHRPLHELTFEEQKREIIDSVQWLKDNFGTTYSFFAFPFSDKGISSKLIEELFAYDSNLILFGNSGIKRDVDSRVIQRFSLENPKKHTTKVLVVENLYKYYNKLVGKYKIKRN